ncbi:glycogen debranching protein [Paenibacillus cellulositrophicus]|uniref:alpha-L-rhamnosidase-related protein n=1 Tax=Paenibacillus cellulositrophicus TaxID=562959 RepID=UPI002042502A|nr:glycogen debranching protein [Paenibacillus cellulositrophicus]MCM2999785.1 glycogen debranching protein [Paenibacillus cellulositrophicus]
MIKQSSRHPFPIYLTAGEYIKAVGTQDGYFPDFGHHVAGEMGGVWLHPIKLLDGFWLRLTDHRRNISVWSKADEFINHPWGSEFRYDHGLGHIPVSMKRVQFAPDEEKGMVVRYEIVNYAAEETVLELEMLFRSDLRPVWYSEQIGIEDGEEDRFEAVSESALIAKDSGSEWYVMVGAEMPGIGSVQMTTDRSLFGPERTAGGGSGASLTASLKLAPGETFAFHAFIAGSYTSRDECIATFDRLKQEHERLFEQKLRLLESIDQKSKLSIEGEDELNEIFSWTKWNTQWLVQKVDFIGRGLTAGSPHYPWWFGCDNSYTVQGLAAVGDFRLAKDTVDILRSISQEANGNGRIVHEITTMGVVANPGNTQETAHFITMIWDLFTWTGDLEMLRENYNICVQGMDWLLHEMDPDGDLFPSGYGIIEISGLNMELIDTAVYSAQAAGALASMSVALGERQRAEAYEALADRMKKAVNRVYWSEEDGLYADAVAPKSDIVPKVDHLVSVAEKHGVQGYRDVLNRVLDRVQDEQEDHGWLLNKNWVIVTPMETGIAEREKAVRALGNMRTEEFIGPYGTYLSGVYRTETMTISTGVHAVAEAVYGFADESLDLLRRMMRTFSMALPGSMNEMSPDYGCAVQAWTLYAMAVPLIRHFFGVKPHAHLNTVHIAPLIPSVWDGKKMKLQQLHIGQAVIDLELRSETGRLHADIANPGGLKVILEWAGQTVIRDEPHIRVTL